MMYSIDQGGQAINASAASLQGATLKMSVSAIGGEYEGKVSSDGNSITGTWSPGSSTPAAEFRARDSADRVGDSRTSAAAQADGRRRQAAFRSRHHQAEPAGRQGFLPFWWAGAEATFSPPPTLSLEDLIVFAYGLHARQVTGGPAWHRKR